MERKNTPTPVTKARQFFLKENGSVCFLYCPEIPKGRNALSSYFDAVFWDLLFGWVQSIPSLLQVASHCHGSRKRKKNCTKNTELYLSAPSMLLFIIDVVVRIGVSSQMKY